jgi:predicted DsbA family dithiol-disulfide isomerase
MMVITEAGASNPADRRRGAATTKPERVLEVEVWSDFVCPWCFIGKRNLDAAQRLLALKHPQARVQVIWHPHPLLPETPIEGLPYQAFYRRRLGSAAAVAARQAQVREAAASAGIAIAFDRIEVFPSTLAAHRLVLQAQREDRDGGRHAAEVIDTLFREYFLLGRDIGRPDVLKAVAARCGITGDPDASALPQSRAIAAGVPPAAGVPLFRFGDGVALVGAQPPEVLLHALERALCAVGAPGGDVRGGLTPA